MGLKTNESVLGLRKSFLIELGYKIPKSQAKYSLPDKISMGKEDFGSFSISQGEGCILTIKYNPSEIEFELAAKPEQAEAHYTLLCEVAALLQKANKEQPTGVVKRAPVAITFSIYASDKKELNALRAAAEKAGLTITDCYVAGKKIDPKKQEEVSEEVAKENKLPKAKVN